MPPDTIPINVVRLYRMMMVLHVPVSKHRLSVVISHASIRHYVLPKRPDIPPTIVVPYRPKVLPVPPCSLRSRVVQPNANIVINVSPVLPDTMKKIVVLQYLPILFVLQI